MKYNKFLAIVLAVLLLVSSIACISVIAAEENENDKTNIEEQFEEKVETEKEIKEDTGKEKAKEDKKSKTEKTDNSKLVEEDTAFEPMDFVDNLAVMGKGMLGIFIVIGIIIFAVYLLGFIGKKK